MKNKITLTFKTKGIYIDKSFNDVKELQEYVLNKYFENILKRNHASKILGISNQSMSQLKHKWNTKQRNNNEYEKVNKK